MVVTTQELLIIEAQQDRDQTAIAVFANNYPANCWKTAVNGFLDKRIAGHFPEEKVKWTIANRQSRTISLTPAIC